MTQLTLARGFRLPLDIATRKTAILAKSGAGKSNTAKVIVEGVLDAGAQVVIIDPVGHWYGLRSIYAIPVLGGMNGDIPLDVHAGKLIADVAAESGQSLILDVSLMDSDGEMQRFAYEFAERFYKQKQLHPTAVLVVLEEADEFAPQDTRGTNVPRMVGAWARIAKRGRGRGIGLLSVTLRSAALSKNVLNQSDGIIAMRTTAPLDIKAIEEWVKATRAEGADAVIPSLPGLETGEAWFWIPEYSVLRRVKVSKARSLDTSATPEVGAAPATRKKLKPIDLAALGARMQSTVEKAKASDPAELQKQLRELDRRLRQADENTARLERLLAERPAGEPQRVEVPVLRDADLNNLRAQIDRLFEIRDELLGRLHDVAGAASTLLEQAQAATRAPVSQISGAGASLTAEGRREASGRPAAARRGEQPRAQHPEPSAAPLAGDLTGPQQRVLDAIAWLNAVGFPQPSKLQVGFIAGYRVGKRVGGTYGNILGQLRGAGYLDYIGGNVVLTDAGAAIATVADIEQTTHGLQQAIYSRLAGPERRVLEVIVAADPKELTKQAVGELAGYTVGDRVGGTFGNILGRLRSLGLIDYPGPGLVAAEPVLFLDGART